VCLARSLRAGVLLLATRDQPKTELLTSGDGEYSLALEVTHPQQYEDIGIFSSTCGRVSLSRGRASAVITGVCLSSRTLEEGERRRCLVHVKFVVVYWCSRFSPSFRTKRGNVLAAQILTAARVVRGGHLMKKYNAPFACSKGQEEGDCSHYLHVCSAFQQVLVFVSRADV